ncbi:hypothetical protein IV203_023574 [Nitzschia inconspicua]|uniref:PDZ domain-containing protein n=1 Tax=Nitzschia inconspicua TaxID=303405 RepID=A0A9K3PCG3_9STRA|nr:hypothetical protein IV203_023574 [Nitzschia inconspicua]
MESTSESLTEAANVICLPILETKEKSIELQPHSHNSPTGVLEALSNKESNQEETESSFVIVSDSPRISSDEEVGMNGNESELDTSTNVALSSQEEEYRGSPPVNCEPASDPTSNELTMLVADPVDGDKQGPQQKEQQPRTEEQQQQIAAILNNIIDTMEPHHYSIATYKDSNRPLGLKLWELDQGGMLVMGIATGQSNSILAGATSHAFPMDGDVLIGINRDSCTSAKTTLMDVKKMVDQSDGKMLTLTFRRPDCKTTKKHQYQRKKNNPFLTEASVQRLTILNPTSASVSLDDITFVGEKKDPTIEETKNQQRDDDVTPLAAEGVVVEEPLQEEQPMLLQIESISSGSWLSKSTCLAHGQLILTIQDIPCFGMSPTEVKMLWQNELYKYPESLTITTYTMSQVTSRNRFRRALLGVGGSVLVGAGVVIMATPLHPLGHVMALGGGHVMTYGGLGVISSQVEGHREKILEESSSNEKRSLRDRWSSIRRRRQSNTSKDLESEASPSVIVSSNDELAGAHGSEVVVEQVSGEVREDVVKSTSFLQRARQSWRNHRSESSSMTSQSFDDLDDEIHQMEQTLAVHAVKK